MQNLMPPINTPDQLFHDGDPTQGIEGTLVTAGYLNNQQGATRDLQQELLNVLGGAHIQPDPKKTDQLLTALRALLLSRKNPFGDIKSDGTVPTALENLGLEDLAKTSANNTFTGEVKFTLSVSLPANTAYKGIGLQALFDYKQDKDDTLTALSGKDVAGLLSYLGLTSAAKTDAKNTFTQKQTFSGSVALPSDTAYKGIGLQALFDYKQDKDDTLTALSGKDVAGLLSYLGLTSAAKTDAENTFTQKQTFSGSVALPSDTALNGTGLVYLFDSKLDASKALGTGQTWVDVTASRTAGVTYTNSTTRPICVSISETGDGDRGIYVGGVLTAFVRGSDSDSTLFAIVPPGAQYIFSGAFSSWAELR